MTVLLGQQSWFKLPVSVGFYDSQFVEIVQPKLNIRSHFPATGVGVVDNDQPDLVLDGLGSSLLIVSVGLGELFRPENVLAAALLIEIVISTEDDSTPG